MTYAGYRRITSWMWTVTKKYRRSIAFTLFFDLLAIVMGWAFVWLSKLALDYATGEPFDVQFTHFTDKNPLWLFIFALAFVTLMRYVFTSFSQWIKGKRQVEFDNQLKTDLFTHVVGAEWRSLEPYHTGDIISRLENDVSSVTTFAMNTLPGIIVLGFQFVGSFLLLWHLDHVLALVLIVILPVFAFFAKYYARKMRQITLNVRQKESEIQSQLQENVEHRVVLKTLEKSNATVSRLKKTMGELLHFVKHRLYFSIGSHLLIAGGFSLGFLFTFGWGIFQIAAGAITYGTLMAFMQLAGRIQRPIADLSSTLPVMVRAYAAAERLMELLHLPAEASPIEEASTSDAPSLMPDGPLGIRLEEVCYSYDQKEIIHDFSHDFRPGTISTIVGETGTGKTTLIRLLLALIKPNRGKIQIYHAGPTPHSAILTPSFRQYFTYVPQGNTLLSGTIRSNLLLANPTATEDEMRQVLKMAVADFVFTQKQGLDTPCGERGGGLSEGQAQRIAIARALLRKAPILLLDECTSALDSQTERRVMENILNDTTPRTIVLVSHKYTQGEVVSVI